MSKHAGRERQRMSPWLLSKAMNFYPPLLGMGLRVKVISRDWTYARAELKLNRLNRNTHGTAFGGSLSAMTDAFLALLLMHQLGEGYLVWDQACEIEFKAPGTGTIYAEFVVTPEVTEEVRAACDRGEKVRRWFDVDLHLADGTVVASARRLVYARAKMPG